MLELLLPIAEFWLKFNLGIEFIDFEFMALFQMKG
jgi:hypothetical protein